MPNRLAGETSPYLLQHQDNPVDWYPWGDEALQRARAEDRPILLSIGYSACHWCHVMEHESFENPRIAQLMNDYFVNIKVDREERPDLDSVYMNAVQQMTGHGGWPMTVFLTPDGVPFYGGTYFPPEPRHGLPSFPQILIGVSEAYHERRDEVNRTAGQLHEMLREGAAMRVPPMEPDTTVLGKAYRRIAGNFDLREGGFGRAPKFPQPMTLDFLLRYWRRTQDVDALAMVEHTIRKMAHGGIYDQVGGGFHRYSVDARWLAPHFEKMLYDNALLARLYLHAYLATGHAEYRRIVHEVLDYVLLEMRSPEGAFYSTQDADSEGEEGKFYLWDPEEIDALLGPDEGPVFRAYYDVTPEGNFEGRNILHVDRDPATVATETGIEEDRLAEILVNGRRILYEARSRRIWPGRDEKVITAWNAMMLRAFAEAAFAFDDETYRNAAVANGEFLLRALRPEGRLLRTYRDASAKIDAFLEDHALLVDALVSLYQATFEARWLMEARAVADAMLDGFWEEEEGVFYDSPRTGEKLVVRPRDVNDSATPSGTSAATVALLRLATLTGEARYRAVAERALRSVGTLLSEIPQAFGEMLGAMNWYLSPAREVVLVGDPRAPDTRALLEVLRRDYRPNTVWSLRDPALSEEEAVSITPLFAQRNTVEGKATAYVCENFACRRPVTDAASLEAELR